MSIKKYFKSITNSQWWAPLSLTFQERIEANDNAGVLILYNSDADGFSSAYFIYRKLMDSCGKEPTNIYFKAVWNYDFSFDWLAKYVSDKTVSLIICLDLPIIQEPDILRNIVSTNKEILIYDHHVVPKEYVPIEGVYYFNSRILDAEKKNHPTAIISALLADGTSDLVSEEYLIAALGLLGDQALHLYPEFYSLLQLKYGNLFDSENLWDTSFGKLTSLVNALFRANPSKEPKGIHPSLLRLVRDEMGFMDIIDVLDGQYNLRLAEAKVRDEVDYYTKKIANDRATYSNGELTCLVLPMKTFSVGVVATILAKDNFSSFVAIGFNAGNRIQFELRRTDAEERSIIDALKVQKKYFTPLTSGGHPMAAGALIKKGEEKEFCSSFSRALGEI